MEEKLEPEVFHLNPEKSNTQAYRNMMRYIMMVLCMQVYYTVYGIAGCCLVPCPVTALYCLKHFLWI